MKKHFAVLGAGATALAMLLGSHTAGAANPQQEYATTYGTWWGNVIQNPSGTPILDFEVQYTASGGQHADTKVYWHDSTVTSYYMDTAVLCSGASGWQYASFFWIGPYTAQTHDVTEYCGSGTGSATEGWGEALAYCGGGACASN